tara:strand:- start:616 stop:876 length:261 start_codon:yes stop_codon:yes gene_type:complete
MHRKKHLDAFNELRVRLKLMEVDMKKNAKFIKLTERIQVVYASTIRELIKRGEKYLSMNPETDDTIRVAIDMDKYISILEKISIKR